MATLPWAICCFSSSLCFSSRAIRSPLSHPTARTATATPANIRRVIAQPLIGRLAGTTLAVDADDVNPLAIPCKIETAGSKLDSKCGI